MCGHQTIEVRGFPRSFLKHAPINGVVDLENTAKGRITQLASKFGEVEDVVVMFRARAALVRFKSAADALKMADECASNPLCVPTLTKLQQKAPPVRLAVKLTEQEIFRTDPSSLTDEQKGASIEREVGQVMRGMIKVILNQNAAVNRTRRLAQRQKHSDLLAVMGNERGKEWDLLQGQGDNGAAVATNGSASLRICKPVCWDYVISGGVSSGGAGQGRWYSPKEIAAEQPEVRVSCPRGSSCDHMHPVPYAAAAGAQVPYYVHLPVHWVPLKVRSRLGTFLKFGKLLTLMMLDA